MFDELKITCLSSGEYKIINIWESNLGIRDLNIISKFYQDHKDFDIEVVG